MRIQCNQYFIAKSIQEVLEILSAAQKPARILAGGTDLVLEIQQGTHPPVTTLVDVTQIDQMRALELRGSSLFIGASVTLTELANSSLTNQHATALADAARLMGNPQVCNVATIGGNVAHALPAADGTIALLALDAQVEIANFAGIRSIPLETLFKGPGETILDPGADLIVGFYLPQCSEGQASAFVRRVNPQGIALAMLDMAIGLDRDENRIANIRIAVGPPGPIPLRMISAEKALLNQTLSPEVKTRALDAILEEAHFRTSPHRATAEYRRHLASILLDEALTMAWQRAEL